MKKFLALALFAVLPACTFDTGDGSIVGDVTDVSKSGFFFTSCEVGIQVGGTSSKVDWSSSRNLGHCERAQSFIGKRVKLEYNSRVGFDPRVETLDFITRISPME